MTALLGIAQFLLSPIGRWVGMAALALALSGGASYIKGRLDGRASYKAKIERQINDAVQKGQIGAADALRKLDSDSLPDDWFRD